MVCRAPPSSRRERPVQESPRCGCSGCTGPRVASLVREGDGLRPPVFAPGGPSDGSGYLRFFLPSHNPLYGTLKEGTRILHSVKPSTNLSKDMRALNRPNPHERNGLTRI